MAIEREIRFLVTDGEPPPGGRRIIQAYAMRKPAARVRMTDGREAKVNLKLARADGSDHEFERTIPVILARALLALPLPRVEKTRRVEGDLEIDTYVWPRRLVVCECELQSDQVLDLRDAEARARWMEARRPDWVRAWSDITHEGQYRAAALAR